jgi:hypothetical protein
MALTAAQIDVLNRLCTVTDSANEDVMLVINSSNCLPVILTVATTA